MIVQCETLYNYNTNTYVKGDTNKYINRHYHYHVLEIYFDPYKNVMFRIIADDGGINSHPILVRAQDFKIISQNKPKNWIGYNVNDDIFTIGPKEWVKNDSWEWSFWQEWDESIPRALECYENELKTIISADPSYIPLIINERANYRFVLWQETMVPFLQNIQKQCTDQVN